MKATRRHGLFLGITLMAVLALAVACGGEATPTLVPTSTSPPASPTPTPTSTPKPTPFDPGSVTLTQELVFGDFLFSIAYPEGWTVESNGPATSIHQFPEDDPRRDDGYSVSLDHRKLDGMYALGLSEDPTLEDLLQLNGRFFGWQVLGVSEVTVFGVPALAANVRGREGSLISLMGLVGDEAFLLSLNAPHEDGLDDFKPVWARMLDSVRPAEVAMTVEQEYFKEVREAQDLANLKFARFNAALGQT